ncbi:hypothetical protein [Campylobacter troglodytis]|uniref:hypothetical protein n=1 Tax=Campylobacter troglodytis TaxID=654363 RepID=UPI00163C1171|nr:hypothetical protein [Campylobacter troglodytis]
MTKARVVILSVTKYFKPSLVALKMRTKKLKHHFVILSVLSIHEFIEKCLELTVSSPLG